MKNKKTTDIQLTKQQAAALYQEAKQVLKATYDGFKQSAGGVLIPKHVQEVTVGLPHKKLEFSGESPLNISKLEKIILEMEKASMLTDIEAKKVVEESKQIKYQDYQQVPKHVALDPAIAPNAKPMDYKKIAAQVKDKQYITDAGGNAQLADGMVLSKQLLSDPVFVQNLKAATVQLTVEQMIKEKQKAAGTVAPPPTKKWEVSESEKEIIKQLGMTEEQYLQWINKEEKPVAIVKGSYNKLMAAGLQVDMEKQKAELEKAMQEQYESEYKYVTPIKHHQKAIKEVLDRPAPVPTQRVLEAIVAGILLSPKTFKLEGDAFVVPKDMLPELERTLRLSVTYHAEDQSYRVRLV